MLKRALILLPLVLALAACAAPPFGQPKEASLIIVQPPDDWGPVTIAQSGQVPVQLSESGVTIEAVGSSQPR